MLSDHRLAEGDAAIISRHLVVQVDFEVISGDEMICFLEQGHVLPHTTAQGDFVNAGLGADLQANLVHQLRYRIVERLAQSEDDPETGTPEMRRLKTTDEHLFWLLDRRRWVPAHKLKAGDVLITADGRKAEIVETARIDVKAVVYTFDVEEYYSYFANGVLIRQRCGGGPEKWVEKRLLEYLERNNNHMAPGATGREDR